MIPQKDWFSKARQYIYVSVFAILRIMVNLIVILTKPRVTWAKFQWGIFDTVLAHG